MQAIYVEYLHSGGKQHCRCRSVAHTSSCSVTSLFFAELAFESFSPLIWENEHFMGGASRQEEMLFIQLLEQKLLNCLSLRTREARPSHKKQRECGLSKESLGPIN